MPRLEAVARALNAGETALAMTSAVLLKFPEPDWNAAVRIAQADELLKYDPDEPRDWRGRWTTRGGGAATKPKVQLLSSPLKDKLGHFLDAYEQQHNSFRQDQQTPEGEANDDPFPLPADWVHLPDADRNDELGDLLESIANAKLSDASAISKEIYRQFVETGDLDDGVKLWEALHDIVTRDNPTTGDRQAILDKYEYLTHIDPSEVGRAKIDDAAQLMQAGLVPSGGSPDEIPEGETPQSDPDAPNPVWAKGWAQRGKDINKLLGSNLADNFPVIDKYADDVITSIKSMDLNAGTYQNNTTLAWRLNSYVDKLASFQGMKWGDEVVPNVRDRVLSLAVPKGSITVAQRSVIEAVKQRALTKNIQLVVTEF